MNTIIIEHADNRVTNAVKELMSALGLPVKTIAEEWVPVEGVIANPEVIKAIEDYESGKTKGLGKTFSSAKELKEEFKKLTNIA